MWRDGGQVDLKRDALGRNAIGVVEEFGDDVFRIAHVADGVACIADEVGAAATKGGVGGGEGGEGDLGKVC